MNDLTANFNDQTWENPADGVRQKCFLRDGLKVRLVEFSAEFKDHWCDKGHAGYVLEGTALLSMEDGTVLELSPGHALVLPSGPACRHKLTVRDQERIRLLLFENA